MGQNSISYELGYATVTIYPKYLVFVASEGEIVRKRDVRDLVEITDRHYSGKFGLVAVGEGPSSVELSVYPLLFQQKWRGKCVAYGSVPRDCPADKLLVETERQLVGKTPYKVFKTREAAEKWVKGRLGAL